MVYCNTRFRENKNNQNNFKQSSFYPPRSTRSSDLSRKSIAASSTASIKVSSHSAFGFQGFRFLPRPTHHMHFPPATQHNVAALWRTVVDELKMPFGPPCRYYAEEGRCNIEHFPLIHRTYFRPFIAFLSDGGDYFAMHALANPISWGMKLFFPLSACLLLFLPSFYFLFWLWCIYSMHGDADDEGDGSGAARAEDRLWYNPRVLRHSCFLIILLSCLAADGKR